MSVTVICRESMLAKVIEVAATVLVTGVLLGMIAIPIFMGTPTSFYTNTSSSNQSTWIVIGTFGGVNLAIWGVIITLSLATVIILIIRTVQHHGAE
jgi:RsiW-degrading membrane proteinase PrsW (M82 family)